MSVTNRNTSQPRGGIWSSPLRVLASGLIIFMLGWLSGRSGDDGSTAVGDRWLLPLQGGHIHRSGLEPPSDVVVAVETRRGELVCRGRYPSLGVVRLADRTYLTIHKFMPEYHLALVVRMAQGQKGLEFWPGSPRLSELPVCSSSPIIYYGSERERAYS